MSLVGETVFFIFGLVAAGYLSGWTGYLRTDQGDAIAEFAVSIALPLLLFRTMAGAQFHGAAPWALWTCYFSAIAGTWLVSHLVVTRMFGLDFRAGVVGGVSGSFSNLVLLGMPFMLGVYGQGGFEVLSLLVSVHVPVMVAASTLLFEVSGRSDGPFDLRAVLRTFALRMLRNPLIIGILAGLAFRMTGLELPSLAARLVDALANVAGPIALFAMGLALRKFALAGTVGVGAALAMLKLTLMPALALGAALLLDLPPLTAKVAVAAASLPSGVNAYLIATQFGRGQALASNAMTIGTALAALTTAGWLMIASAVFG